MTSETNTRVEDWLTQEAEELESKTPFEGNKLPGLKFEENKITKFSVDFSLPFNTYDDSVNKVVKAIIPVVEGEEKKILWLNKKNPLYVELIHAGRKGQTEFSVIQIGSKANTKYNLLNL